MSSGCRIVALCVFSALAAAGPARAQSLDLPRRMRPVIAIPADVGTSAYATQAQMIEPEGVVEPAPYRVPEPIFEPTELAPLSAFSPAPAAYIQAQNIEVLETPSAIEGQVVYEPLPDAFTNAGNQVFEDPSLSWDESSIASAPCESCQSCGEGETCPNCAACRTWQLLPTGIIYHSYLAGPKEPRFAANFWRDKRLGWQLDYTVGGRVGLVRYGTTDNLFPQGFELDLEGAAFPRVNLNENMDLDAADYRVGVPLTYGKDKWQAKLAIYHLSAHVGDEFLIRNPTFERINYVRDAVVLGYSCYPVNLLRLYAEAEWAFNRDGGAKPWAFQLGFELSPRRYNGFSGDPFLAVNASLREDVDFGGNLCLQTGWQWRGPDTQRLLRMGFHLLTGKSNQFEFYDQNETQLGLGLWYDF